ncbi:MAG TPA: response regulator [Candidatus Nanoarchaeia archaeon]|nr:response regulator [Candidatus Nanoarchaeia archaeon]
MAGKRKILVVDDDLEDLKLITAILKKNKLSVHSATNGKEALIAAQKAHYDIILIDLLMPTLSGYDVVNLLHERINHGTHIIFISVIPKNKVDLKNVDGFIQKPFSPESIIRGIKEALNKA